jgi:hypothetical protein
MLTLTDIQPATEAEASDFSASPPKIITFEKISNRSEAS